MKRNLREQILFRIVRLSGEGYFQQEVVRMLGVSQECVSKILQRNRDTGRPHQQKRGGRKSFITDRKDRQLVRVNGFISAPRLRVGMILRFWKRLSVQSIVNRLLTAGYQSRRPARCPRRLTEGGASGTRGTVVFSNVDGRTRMRRSQGKELIYAWIVLWGAIQHGGRNELVVLDGTLNHQRCIRLLRDSIFPGRRAFLDATLFGFLSCIHYLNARFFYTVKLP